MKELIYNILDKSFYRNGKQVIISGVKIRLPIKYHKYYEKDYEEESVSTMKSLVEKNDIVLDIGAQLGLMTKFFSDLTGDKGEVYAFEPTPSTYVLLNRTVKMNHLRNVKTVKKAVSNEKGRTFFNISSSEASAANSLAPGGAHENNIKIEVDLISIDEFIVENGLAKLDFIKIDAEGAELSVLRGAKNAITKHKPKILLALHPDMIKNFGDSLKDIFHFCIDFGYSVFYQGARIDESDFISKQDLFDVLLYPNN